MVAIMCEPQSEEPVSKCSVLPEIKSKILDSERGKAIPLQAGLTTGIRGVFRGLKFEPDVPPAAGEKGGVLILALNINS